MTQSEFELLEIKAGDFLRDLSFMSKTSRDQYVTDVIEDLKAEVKSYLGIIKEAVGDSD